MPPGADTVVSINMVCVRAGGVRGYLAFFFRKLGTFFEEIPRIALSVEDTPPFLYSARTTSHNPSTNMASVEFTDVGELRAFFEKKQVFAPHKKDLDFLMALLPDTDDVHDSSIYACHCVTAYLEPQSGLKKCHVVLKIRNSIKAAGLSNNTLGCNGVVWYRLKNVEQWFAAHFNRFTVEDVFGPLLEKEAGGDENSDD
jgi:hypothetical protein